MLALAKSALNQHYRETWEEAVTTMSMETLSSRSYGQWLCGLTGPHLLSEMCPYADAFALPEREVDRLASLHCWRSTPTSTATIPVMSTVSPSRR